MDPLRDQSIGINTILQNIGIVEFNIVGTDMQCHRHGIFEYNECNIRRKGG